MSIFQLREENIFPPVHLADEDGLLAFGGDLSAERLILAYESGIFPWYNADQPVLWWSPPKRMMLYPGKFKVRKNFQKVLDAQPFTITTDEAFEEVIKQCGTVPRPGQDGTWITDEIIQAYVHLHHLGFAHSVECWQGNALVGGLYGVSLGRAFFGESMFSKVSEASKVAFHHLHQLSIEKEFHFIDCQLYTDHLASLGAYEIPREQYLRELRKALDFPDLIGPWKHD